MVVKYSEWMKSKIPAYKSFQVCTDEGPNKGKIIGPNDSYLGSWDQVRISYLTKIDAEAGKVHFVPETWSYGRKSTEESIKADFGIVRETFDLPDRIVEMPNPDWADTYSDGDTELEPMFLKEAQQKLIGYLKRLSELGIISEMYGWVSLPGLEEDALVTVWRTGIEDV